jgi:hypothetical protein
MATIDDTYDAAVRTLTADDKYMNQMADKLRGRLRRLTLTGGYREMCILRDLKKELAQFDGRNGTWK